MVAILRSMFDLPATAFLQYLEVIYHLALYPLAGVAQYPLNWLLTMDGLSLPAGWEDWAILYFSFALIEFRFLWRGLSENSGASDNVASAVFFILVSLFWPLHITYFFWSPFFYKGPRVRTHDDDEDEMIMIGRVLVSETQLESMEYQSSDWFVLMRREVITMLLLAGLLLLPGISLFGP